MARKYKNEIIEILEEMQDGDRFTNDLIDNRLNCNPTTICNVITELANEGFETLTKKQHKGNIWQKGQSDSHRALDKFNAMQLVRA